MGAMKGLRLKCLGSIENAPAIAPGFSFCEEQPILEEGNRMRKQFLIHKLGGTFLTVDITGVGMKAQTVGTTQFASWEKLEEYFLGLGATQDALDNARKQVEKSGTASLLI
jgi:hypothetical protein